MRMPHGPLMTAFFLDGTVLSSVSTIGDHRDWSQLKRCTKIKLQDLIQKLTMLLKQNKKVNIILISEHKN